MEYDESTHYMCSVCKRLIEIKKLQHHCLMCANEFGIKCGNCSRRVANENYNQHIRVCIRLYNNDNKHIDNNQPQINKNKASPFLPHNRHMNLSDVKPKAERLIQSEKPISKAHLRKLNSANDFEIIETIEDFTKTIQLIP